MTRAEPELKAFDLRLGDCVAGMGSLAPLSVDVTVTDPPYAKDLYARTRTNKGSGLRPNGRPVCKSEGADRTSAIQLGNLRIGAIDDILPDVAAHLMRVTRRWIIVWCDDLAATWWREAFGSWFIRLGVWAKTDPMPQVTGDRPAAGCEFCVIAHRPGRKRWNGGGKPALWIGGTAKGHARPDHPSPKPLWLMNTQIDQFTEPGELVLDPFAGSGTTGIAALSQGRRFLGWERDEQFHAMATRRLAGGEGSPRPEQPSLFGTGTP